MVLLLVVQIIKFTFDVPVVVIVSHIPVMSRTPVNYVTRGCMKVIKIS